MNGGTRPGRKAEGTGITLIGTIFSVLCTMLVPFLALPALSLLAPKTFSRPADFLARAARHISEGLMAIALWASLLMALAQFFAVLARYLFGFSAAWLGESVIYFHASLFMLGAAGALKAGAHVRIDVFFAKFSPENRAIVDFLGVHFALWPMMILILTAGEGFVAASWRVFERSAQSDGLPLLFLLKSLIPVFALSMIVQGFAMAVEAGRVLRGMVPSSSQEHEALPL